MSAIRFLRGALLLTACTIPLSGFSQDEVETDADSAALTLGDIVVVGTRVRGVAVEDLAVPVDVYDIQEITTTGSEDLTVALQKTSPSFNSKRNALGDGGLFHTAALRGMSADHTLVLVNGKRRHSISFPRPLETAGQGTTGADLRAIPLAAIERIEVLRDGAATQYGSDAIGGVINVVLKENAFESTASARAGVTAEGDGRHFGASSNVGIALGENGVLNLTAEVYDQERIDRAFDTSHLDVAAPHDPPIGRKMVLGEPEHDIQALFLNAVVPMGDGSELYAFGGWSSRNGRSSGAWRDPVWAAERLVGPVYPDGFLPFEDSTSEDQAIALGYRSSFGKWDADVSWSFGANTFDFGATDSINSSWAAEWLQRELDGGRSLADITFDEVRANAGPASGDSGGTKLENWSLDLDVAGQIDLGGNAVDAAFGAEYRREQFGIRAGDFVSWGCGLPDNADVQPTPPPRRAIIIADDGTIGQLDRLATCGHQGYPGYSPVNAQFSVRDRDSQALWADFRHDISDDWNVEAATRFERYEGAGSSITGMVGSRIDLNPTVSLRATASTGFRAPSLPQLGFNTIVFSGDSAGGLSVTSHLEDGAAFEFFGEGSPDLQHETSRNLSFGAVWTPSPDLSISADIYRIDIRDRITLVKHDPDCAAADAAACGRLAAERGIQHITNIQFFANAVDTTTSGLDIVASRDWPFMEGQFTLSGTLHFNETDIDKEIETISSSTKSYIEEGTPRQRHRISGSWTDDDMLELNLGVNYFGKASPQWLLGDPNCPGEISPAWIADASVRWLLADGMRLTVGVDNLLDQYPDQVNQECSDLLNGVLGWGILYNPDATYGLSGRIWYTRLDATF
ncbi:MAG: TonB-dependent receptor [Rhodospirillales bacterium]|nr:TonB-dependent receptor [Rhodospirillales bacterium]